MAVPGAAPLAVAGVHLSLNRLERTRHVALVLDAAPAHLPFILAGDVNEESDGAAWGWLAERLRWVTPPTPTFPARAPRRTIDAVFASPSLRVAPRTEVVLNRDDLFAATDHLPVWADFELA